MKKEEMGEIINNFTAEEKKILKKISDKIIERAANTNPKALLLKVYDDLCFNEYSVIDKAMDSKEEEKIKRTVEILKQVNAILKDFEKEVF